MKASTYQWSNTAYFTTNMTSIHMKLYKLHMSICNNQPDGEGEKKNSESANNTTTFTTLTTEPLTTPKTAVCLLKTAPPLPTNHKIRWKRAWSLVNCLSELLQTYNKIIAEQVKKGFIEKVLDTPDDNKTHFTTTPIRIVYDCSCYQSSNLPSLNDCLPMNL